MKKPIKISASIMCADLFNLGQDINELENAKVEYLHLDIMDGHFVDNITLGFDCCRRIATSHIPRDIHLLVTDPEKHIDSVDLKKNDIFQFHFECHADIASICNQVHAKGALVGIVLNPETPIEKLHPYLQFIDLITLMMIRPGFAGRKMEPGMLEKIEYTRKYLDSYGYNHIIIEVDGNVNPHNVKTMHKNGAQIVVAGTSSIFNKHIEISDGVSVLRESSII